MIFRSVWAAVCSSAQAPGVSLGSDIGASALNSPGDSAPISSTFWEKELSLSALALSEATSLPAQPLSRLASMTSVSKKPRYLFFMSIASYWFRRFPEEKVPVFWENPLIPLVIPLERWRQRRSCGIISDTIPGLDPRWEARNLAKGFAGIFPENPTH